MINFKEETKKIQENMYTFKILYFSKFDCKKTYDILGGNYKYYIYKFKTFHLKIPLEENIFWGKKSPKKTIVPSAK
jgi:hypothetical protein